MIQIESNMKNFFVIDVGCLEEYFRPGNEKENQADFSGCKSVLYSKSTEESLVNFRQLPHGYLSLSIFLIQFSYEVITKN